MQLPSYDQSDTSLSVNFSLEGESTGHKYDVAPQLIQVPTNEKLQ